MRTYGTPFVTKLEIAYGHHVSELRREKKKRKEELCSLALALSLTLTLTLYHLPTSYYGTPFVTKLEIAYGHHVSELRRNYTPSGKKKK